MSEALDNRRLVIRLLATSHGWCRGAGMDFAVAGALSHLQHPAGSEVRERCHELFIALLADHYLLLNI